MNHSFIFIILLVILQVFLIEARPSPPPIYHANSGQEESPEIVQIKVQARLREFLNSIFEVRKMIFQQHKWVDYGLTTQESATLDLIVNTVDKLDSSLLRGRTQKEYFKAVVPFLREYYAPSVRYEECQAARKHLEVHIEAIEQLFDDEELHYQSLKHLIQKFDDLVQSNAFGENLKTQFRRQTLPNSIKPKVSYGGSHGTRHSFQYKIDENTPTTFVLTEDQLQSTEELKEIH